MYSLIILLLINYVRAQQDLCSCSCCIGQSCTPTSVGILYMPNCTTETCLISCRTLYSQCQTAHPNGQVLPQCSSNISTSSPLFNCQCNCCNTGSATCTPFFVGYSTAYLCESSACSISCSQQHPGQCVSDHNGQTIGTCIGPITTTITTMTTTAISITTVSTTTDRWLSNICSCKCCQSGPGCTPNIDAGIAIASQCSSLACTEACQNEYLSICPSLADLGQTNGTCIGQSSGNTRCQCQCCETNGCSSYEITTNVDCTLCEALCRRESPCTNTHTITNTCTSNKSKKSIQFSLSLNIFIPIIVFPLFFL